MYTDTKELNLNEMEMVDGAGFWNDLKTTFSYIGSRLEHHRKTLTDAIVAADQKNRESGDPTPAGVAWALGMGAVQGFIDIAKGK